MSDPDLLPRRWRRMPDDARLAARALRRIFNLLRQSGGTRISRAPGRLHGRGPSALLPTVPHMQRCAVWVRYARNRGPSQWRQHGAYLAREGAQREGAKGRGFNADRDDVDLGQALDKWQRAGDARLFKLVVSPEFGERLDLREHARSLVAHMEQDMRTRLEWVAIDHYNTDNPHVHLLVRGVDQDGKPLEIDPGYIRHGIRARAQEVATRRLGYRTDKDAEIARERQVAQQRYTALDRELLTRAGAAHVVRIEPALGCNEAAKIRRLQEIRRLKQLERMGVAEQVGHLLWRLDPDMERMLRRAGINASRLKILERHRKYMANPTQALVVTELKPGDRLTGRLLGAGLEPDTERPYLLIEDRDGKAHFVAQSFGIGAAPIEEMRPIGHVVTVSVRGDNVDGREKRPRLHIEDRGPAPKLSDQKIAAGAQRLRRPSSKLERV